jgi:hypothetical protein
MLKNLKHTLLTTLFCLATANATTLAVLEITISESEDEIDLTVDETKFLTDELRRQATKILPKDYSVLTREKIISLVPKTAENLNSVIDIGIVIKSDYITQGFIGKLGGLFTLTVELYETSSGSQIGDFVKEATDYKGLLEAIRENSPALFAKIMPQAKPDTVASIPTNIPAEPKKSNNSFWVALGLDVLGATAIGLGIYNNSKSSDYSKECKNITKTLPNPDLYPNEFDAAELAFNSKHKKMQSAETARNIFYATGGALLLGGVAVHIWF